MDARETRLGEMCEPEKSKIRVTIDNTVFQLPR